MPPIFVCTSPDSRHQGDRQDYLRSVPLDEIATAIAAARGDLLVALRLGKVSIVERPESRRAVRYDGSIHIFFDR